MKLLVSIRASINVQLQQLVHNAHTVYTIKLQQHELFQKDMPTDGPKPKTISDLGKYKQHQYVMTEHQQQVNN